MAVAASQAPRVVHWQMQHLKLSVAAHGMLEGSALRPKSKVTWSKLHLAGLDELMSQRLRFLDCMESMLPMQSASRTSGIHKLISSFPKSMLDAGQCPPGLF